MGYLLATAVNWFAEILVLLLLARAILSWFVGMGNGSLYRVYAGLSNLTEPIVAPCRMLLSKINTGPLDFSVLLAMILISALRRIIVTLIFLVL